MRLFARWILAVCVLFVLPTVQAGEDAAAPPPRYTSGRQLPGAVTVAVLSNGLTVIVQENHAAPVATVRCYVKNTGSAFEGKNLGAGLSHVLEHVVAGGSTTHRTEKEIEEIVNTFGGATNAATSTDMTQYFIDCPAKNAMQAIELVADAMQHVKFEPSEFARELKVVRQELSDGEVNRQRVLWKLLQQTVYTTHPARHPVIGYLDVLNDTTNQTIIDFYRERYVPNNQVFVVVGDVETRKVLDQVAMQYAGTPRGRETYVAMEDEPEQLSPREAAAELDGATFDLALAWPTVKLSHPDLYALDLAAYILGEGESSRLARRLKHREQTVLTIHAASDTPHYVAGCFIVTAVCRPETWEKAAEGIVEEVYRLRDELVAPDDLAKAKKQKAAELIFGRQTVQQSADSLGRGFLTAGDPLFDAAYVEGIQKVTAEQIREVARRYFVPERLNRVMVAPPGGAPKTAERAAKKADDAVRLERLPNGLRVLLKRDGRLPLVNIQAFVLGGSLADDEATAGRAALVGAMLDRGTAEHSAEQIAEYFDSIGGQLSMGAGRFTVFGSASTLREDFPKAAALFAECFMRPTFPAEEFAKVQRIALGAIARRAGDPYQEINEFFCDNLPAGSPYRVIQGGKAETVQKLSAEDLRAYHARYFVPNRMIVTIFGDIDADEAFGLAKRLFGDFKPSDEPPPTWDRANAIHRSVARHKKTGKPTGMVWVGYPTAGIFEKEDYAAMTVLGAIMAGYGYPGGWLHNELRGEGLVYAVHGVPMTGPAPGYFNIIAQTQPDRIGEVVERIERNIQRAKEGQFDEAEFRTAVQRVVAMHAQDNTTIAEQARQAALDELYGLGYDYEKTFDARIEAVTPADAARVARKFFVNHVRVTSSPESASGEK